MPRPNFNQDAGQIVPQARPVDAFIRPEDRNIAQPNQPTAFGTPKGISTVSTGGTTYVQGENKLARLAQDLQEFNPALIKTAQAAGLAYADEQMRQGEIAAREQVQRGLALNDAEMEASELDRAAENRKLANRDPVAGGIMATLNPYFGIGFKRGLVKQAGLEARTGLGAYVQERSHLIDYNRPDQGFGQLAQWQAEYTNQLTDKFGIDSSSPGFQKYFLPEMEKARESINTKHLSDRKSFFDNAAVDQSTMQLIKLHENAMTTGQVEFMGRVYRRSDGEQQFQAALFAAGDVIVQRGVLNASLPGEAGKRSQKIFTNVANIANYEGRPDLLEFVSNISSNDLVRDENGKPVIDPNTGQPMRMRWGDLYQQEGIDSESSYQSKAVAQWRRTREVMLESAGGFDEGLLAVAAQYEPGPARAEAISQYVAQWYNENGAANGISLSELEKRRANLVKLDNQIYFEGSDPNAADSFFADLGNDLGDLDGKAWRNRIDATAALILDPDERSRFRQRAAREVAQREREQATFSQYKGARDAEIRKIVAANIAQFYDSSAKDRFGNPEPAVKANMAESKRRQTAALTDRANQLITAQEDKLGRKLTDSEVRSLTRAAFYGDQANKIPSYPGMGQQSQPGAATSPYQQLFPGSKLSGAPGVSGASSSPDANAPTGPVAPAQLPRVPVANLKTYKTQPILSGRGALDAWQQVKAGKTSQALRDAANRAGAASPADFVLAQMDVWSKKGASSGASAADLAKFRPSSAERQRVTTQSRKANAGSATPVSAQNAQQQYPNLPGAGGGWTVPLLTGLPQPRRPTGAPPAPVLPPAPESGRRPAGTTRTGARLGYTGTNLSRGARTITSAEELPQQFNQATLMPPPVGQLQQTSSRGWLVDENGTLYSSVVRGPTASQMRRAAGGYGNGNARVLALSGRNGLGSAGGAGYSSADPRGQSLIQMAGRLGVDPADLAAIFSYETGGTLNPSEPGRGAAAGRIGLIQAGPNERAAYGLGSGSWEQEMLAVEKYLRARGVKPGMGLPDIYAAVNGGNVGAGWSPDGNGVVARASSTQRQLKQHREQAAQRLGLRKLSGSGTTGPAASLQMLSGVRGIRSSEIGSAFGAHESFRRNPHGGQDLRLAQRTAIGFNTAGRIVSVNRTNSTASEANGGYGSFMDIQLPNGNVIRIAHLAEIAPGLRPGMTFSPGQMLARTGGAQGAPGSGRSTGPHLHMELLKGRMGTRETLREKLDPHQHGAVSLLQIGNN